MALLYRLQYPVLEWEAVGTVDHGQQLEVARQSFVAIEGTGDRGWHLLIDLSRSIENRTAGELRELAQLVGRHAELLSGRIAMVTQKPLLRGTSRMFAAYVEEYGVEVRVFGTGEEALSWLVPAPHMGAEDA